MSNRTLKAWECRTTWSDSPRGDIVYALTAGKARHEYLCLISDQCPDVTHAQIKVRRAHGSDMPLPPPHRLVTDLSDGERQIILHAYGYCSTKRPQDWGRRDHYCTSPCDGRLHRLAWELGLFSGPHGKEDGYGEVRGWVGAFYYLTALGQHVARSMIPVDCEASA
jgi:hypothetical protein